jgi:hypothetical protein
MTVLGSRAQMCVNPQVAKLTGFLQVSSLLPVMLCCASLFGEWACCLRALTICEH